MAFDPALLMYYVPELAAFSNVETVEGAYVYNTSNPATFSSILPFLPGSNVDVKLFLLQQADIVDVSSLNHVVRAAMSNQGLSVQALDNRSAFFDFYQAGLTTYDIKTSICKVIIFI